MTPKMADCEHCGASDYNARDYDRVSKTLDSIRKQYESACAHHAVEMAKQALKWLDNEERFASLQRKVQRQRKEINRLQDRLRKRGVAPYGEDENAAT